MKKKFFIAALAATVFAATAIGLAACSKDGAYEEQTSGGGDKVYTITLDANGGSFAGGATTQQIQTDTAATVKTQPDAPIVAPADHTFRGWGITATASNTLKFPYTASGNRTIYALWQDNGGGGEEEIGVYTITFNAQGGTFDDEIGSTVTRETSNGKISAAQLPDVTYEGHTLLGWYTQVNGGGTLVTTETFTADGNAYAYWKENGGGGETVTLPLEGMVAVEDGNQTEDRPNMYVVGSFSGSDIQDEYGYFAEYVQGEYGPEYKAEGMHLSEGDMVLMYAPSWTFYCAVIESGCTVDDYIEIVEENGHDYFKILQSGTYSFYLKNEWQNDRIWVSVDAD